MLSLGRVGFLTVWLYALLFYFPQFVLHLANPALFDERFDRFDALPFALFIPVFFFIYFTVKHIPLERIPYGFFRPWKLRFLFENPAMTLSIALLHLIAGITIFSEYGVSIRFREAGLRSANKWAVIGFFTISYARIWLLYHYFRAMNHPEASKWLRLNAFVFGTGFLLGLNTSTGIIDVLGSYALVFLSPVKLRRFLVKQPKANKTSKKVQLRLVITLIVFPLVIGSMAYFGFFNKAGSAGVAQFISRGGYLAIVASTVARASTSYFSVLAFAQKRLFDLEFYKEIYAIPLNSFWYRLSLIFSPNLPLDRPEIFSITRLNLLNYLKPMEAYTLGPVGGASPGMVAAGFYMAPFPMGFILMSLYVLFFARLINGAVRDKAAKVTVLLPLFLVLYLNTLVESPLDNVAIDPQPVFVVLLILALVALNQNVKQHVDPVP